VIGGGVLDGYPLVKDVKKYEPVPNWDATELGSILVGNWEFLEKKVSGVINQYLQTKKTVEALPRVRHVDEIVEGKKVVSVDGNTYTEEYSGLRKVKGQVSFGQDGKQRSCTQTQVVVNSDGSNDASNPSAPKSNSSGSVEDYENEGSGGSATILSPASKKAVEENLFLKKFVGGALGTGNPPVLG
jgi:hypothetical protein